MNATLRECLPAEKGCIEYGPTVDVATDLGPQLPVRDNVVTVIEKWESVEALKAHLAIDHMVDMKERAKGLIKSLQLHVLQPAP